MTDLTPEAGTPVEQAAVKFVTKHEPFFDGAQPYGIASFEAGARWAQEQAGRRVAQGPPSQTYEGTVVFADGTRWSLQCYDGDCSSCPGTVLDNSGATDTWNCEHPACPVHSGQRAVGPV